MGNHLQKKIVTIGGGTGTFVVLSGLKRIPDVFLTAIVSVLDDGGSTGRLRDAYGFLPVGDARQALIALAPLEKSRPPVAAEAQPSAGRSLTGRAKNGGASTMRQLFEYRFSKGDIAGHNFGNLFLTALTDILGSDAAAIEAASHILRVKGTVLPVSNEPATLVATLENGETITGEHSIDARTTGRSPIASLKTKEPVSISDEARQAILAADFIVLGPGDLYASTLAEFAVFGVMDALKNSKARIAYIVNLFTKAGQTDGFSASRHVEEVMKYTGRKPDAVIFHSGSFPQEVLNHYAAENEFPVADDLPQESSVVRGSFADVVLAQKVEGDTVPRSLVRHSSEKLASAIETLL
ncbi:MAG TPA: gluconeogenesis factor YvcK family protein [Candidatus Paceibacterota bacterium]